MRRLAFWLERASIPARWGSPGRVQGRLLKIGALIALGAGGCAHVADLPEYQELERQVPLAAGQAHPDGDAGHQVIPPPPSLPTAAAIDPASTPTPDHLLGPQPVDVFIRHALAENRTVQAARYNVMALKARVPQVTSLDDPVVSNTIAPIPSLAPQYSLMGYNPLVFLIAQQFPWFGTLRLRGLAAEEDAKVALFELCAAQLDVVANVKRAYYDLHFNERSEGILLESRKLAEDLLENVKVRYETSNAGLQNVLQAEVAIRDLDRELARVRQGVAAARAELAQQLHASPDSELRTLSDATLTSNVPEEVDRLYQLAVAVRPELQGRIAAIQRDRAAVELARKRYYPNPTVGVDVMAMTKGGFVGNPASASGTPNLMFFLAFNLPVYRKKLDAGVIEAQARAMADSKLYDAERDAAYREVKDLFSQAQSQRSILGYFRKDILPRARQALETATSGYANEKVDFPTVLTAWREVLQIQLQVAQVESDLGKALASLERAVGSQVNEHPIADDAKPAEAPAGPRPSARPSPGPDRLEPLPTSTATSRPNR
ncbi:MAG: TolC family protein [Isosphaeraceae bacterium]